MPDFTELDKRLELQTAADGLAEAVRDVLAGFNGVGCVNEAWLTTTLREALADYEKERNK